MCIRDSSNGVSLNTKQVTIHKVSNNDNSNNESTSSSKIKSDSSDVIKNVVLESGVEFNNKVLVSVDEVVRECEERLGGQRADFSQIYSETRFSPWCYEDRVSSGSCVEDKVSSNSP